MLARLAVIDATPAAIAAVAGRGVRSGIGRSSRGPTGFVPLPDADTAARLRAAL